MLHYQNIFLFILIEIMYFSHLNSVCGHLYMFYAVLIQNSEANNRECKNRELIMVKIKITNFKICDRA